MTWLRHLERMRCAKCLVRQLLITACMLFSFGASQLAHALTLTASPSTCASTGSGQAWNNPGNATSSNNSYATVSVDGTTSRYLQCVNFQFATIPDGSRINGITVNVERKSNSTNNGGSQDSEMKLVKAGTIVTAADRATTTTYTTTDVVESHGGSSDLWGTTWTTADIKDTNFGAAFETTKPNNSGGSHTVSVDAIQIVIDYDPPPTIVSIDRLGSSPTNASSVQWLITFSENVTGVAINNFTLSGTGTSGAAVTGVTGSGTSWTVSANTGATGTLGLNLLNNVGNIKNAAGIALATTMSATAGNTYTIDRTSPMVASINITGFTPTSAASVQWEVTFSEDVTGVVAGNFALASTGLTGTPAITSVTGSGTIWLVTASTGSGNGSLGLNLTSVGSIADTLGNALSGVPFTGQTYTIDRAAPSACYTDDFTLPLGTNWRTNSSGTSTFVPVIVSSGGTSRLRLTDNSAGVSTSTTLKRIFPGAGNKIVLEFDYFSYNGSGADGIAVALSDALVAPIPGAFGGSLGYAQKGASPVSDCAQAGGCPGFNGGWLGVGLDEYGGFVTNTEGRSGGIATATANVVTIRGSGSEQSGYNYHERSGVLTPGTASSASTTPAPGHRYRITVDHTNGVNAFVTVDRDTTAAKTGYTNIIPAYDAKAKIGQAAVPENWTLSYTGSTGANRNYHEVANLKVCTTQNIITPVLDHVRIVHDGSASTCAPETVTIKACADANCSALYLGPVTVALTASGATFSPGSSLSFSGQTQVNLTKTTAGTVTLGGTVTSSSGVPAVCYNGGTAGACSLVFSTFACSFDAVEVGQASGGLIYTKIAGVPFTVDVLSLAAGTDTRNATVDLVDQSGVAGGICSSTVLPGSTSQTTTFPNGTRRRTLTFTSASVAADVRVRIQKTNNPISTSCSSDNFAIRPASFSVASTNATNVTSAGTPVFKAGAGQFRLDATSATGYTGTAKINQNRTEAHAGSVTAGSVSGLFSAASSGSSWLSSGTTFTYSEVGNFRFKPWGVYDDGSFADVDRQKLIPECRIDNNLGSNVDPGDPNVLDVNGKYGCYFGGTIASPYFGRFIPNHFSLSSGAIVTRTDLTCSPTSSIFTYIGEPMSANFTLRAQSAGGQTTQNYNGTTWAKLLPSAVVSPGSNPLGLGAVDNAVTRVPFPACGSVPAAPCVLPTTASGSFANGVASVVLPFSVYRDVTTPSGPYSLFDVGAAPMDSDGVTLDTFDLDTVNIVAAANNRAKIARTDVRYGRLALANANGSELLDLSVKIRAEYWKSGVGFVVNADDSCSVFSPGNGVLKNTIGGITPGGIASAPTNILLSGGAGSIVLKKPSAVTGKGSVDFCTDLDSSTQRDTSCQASVQANMPWLQGKWRGTLYDDDPSARVTFGVFRSGPVIYMREIY